MYVLTSHVSIQILCGSHQFSKFETCYSESLGELGHCLIQWTLRYTTYGFEACHWPQFPPKGHLFASSLQPWVYKPTVSEYLRLFTHWQYSRKFPFIAKAIICSSQSQQCRCKFTMSAPICWRWLSSRTELSHEMVSLLAISYTRLKKSPLNPPQPCR